MDPVVKVFRAWKEILAMVALVGTVAVVTPYVGARPTAQQAVEAFAAAQQGDPLPNRATLALIIVKLDSIERTLTQLQAVVRLACTTTPPRTRALAGLSCP